MILDGVVDPTGWGSFKVTFDTTVVETPFHLSSKLLGPSLMDAEKTYSGLTNACAAAGRAGCKLVEFTGDNSTGDDVKALLNYALDVIYFFPRLSIRTDSVSISGGPRALSRWSCTPG